MTFSILTFDKKTGTFAAAAATGSLCVGGWVLRGDIESGLVASQGTSPSTFWRDDVLRAMYRGQTARDAVEAVTSADPGKGHRQLIAMDRDGATHGFTGADSLMDPIGRMNGIPRTGTTSSAARLQKRNVSATGTACLAASPG